ncbi:DAF36 desaturase, partial [Acromyrmex heyeri]
YQFFQEPKEALSTFWTHCPHLGANMAEGGRVKGDCLECPFHNWKFRGEDGYCENIPYTIKVSIAFQCHTIVILVIDMCKVAASLFANVFVNATMEQMRYESGGREGDVKDGDRSVSILFICCLLIVFSYNHSQTRLYLQLGHSHAHTDSWAFTEWKKGESIDILFNDGMRNTRANIIIFRFDGLKMACPSFLKDTSFLLSSKQYPSTPKPAAATTCAEYLENKLFSSNSDVTENGPDIVYLNELHGSPIFLFGKDERQKGVSIHPIENDNGNRHFTVAQNRDRSREKHKANVHLCHKLMLLERFSIMESDIRAEQIGPGIIELNVNTSFGSLYILLTIMLIELLLQWVIYLIFSPPLLAPYANLLFLGECVMFERDIRIWNSKRFEQHPILLREDLIIQVYHRWYSQFYSDHCPTYGHEGFTVVAVPPFCNVTCIISVIFV